MTTTIFSSDASSIGWSDVDQFSHQYGVKCGTILTVPRCWTPPFAIISHEITQNIGPNIPLTCLLGASTVERLRSLGGDSNHIIVRSSVLGETIWDRGTYESVAVQCDASNFFQNLNDATKRILASAQPQKTGLLVQRFERSTQRGEFGNLLRISKTRDQWEISTVDNDGTTTRQRLNCHRDQAADPGRQLEVRPGLARERLFGSIGAWLNSELLLGKRQRLNCEWITDNQRYYLVQVDQEDEDFKGFNPFQVPVLPSKGPPVAKGRYLRQAVDDAIGEWDKLGVLDQLWEPEARHKPTLFFVPLADLPSPSDKKARLALEGDFRKLVGAAGIIVRTSVPSGEDKIFNLPRTEGLSPKEAAAWCLKTARQLQVRAKDLNLAFVAHRFVASRASAWVRVDPRNAHVEIHALWGLPDALQFCPYDIWEVHLPTGTAIDYPEYKSDMLVSTTDGHWKYARVKNELARYNSITSAQAKELAMRSSAIAKRLNRGCHIMWFTGCIDEEGAAFNMPWYWTEMHEAEPNLDRTAFRTIDVFDTESLRIFKEWEGSRRRQALVLRPKELELMRDNTFIEDVGEAAREANVPIVLTGSTLAHAYYILRTKGCTVVTPSEKEYVRIRRKVKLGKLVRDNIPARIEERQEYSLTKQVSNNVKKGFLFGKLIEEAMEVRGAQGHRQKLEELADLFEIVRAMANAEGVSVELMRSEAERKRLKAGGFEKGLVLMKTGITATERESRHEVEQGAGTSLAEQVSYDTIEIPFTFFGFMEIEQSRSLRLKEFGLWLEISLRSDRIELRLVRAPDQLSLPLE